MFVCVCAHATTQLLSCVWIFVTLWTAFHGIFRARILEWVTISSSRRSSLPRDPNCVSCVSLHWQADSLPLSHLGNPICNWVFFSISGFPCGSAGKESTCNAGDLGSTPGLGRSPGQGKGYRLQYSGLENSIDYIVHGVAKSRTWLRDFRFTSWESNHVKMVKECELLNKMDRRRFMK